MDSRASFRLSWIRVVFLAVLANVCIAGPGLPSAPSGSAPGIAPSAGGPSFGYTATDLGTLGGSPLFPYADVAYAMNGRGQIVGSSVVGVDIFHAFLWQSGSMTDLGTLGNEPRSISLAWAINNAGQIVGFSNAPTGEAHAVLWENGRITDLGPGEARDINQSGAIVGADQSSGPSTTHAFLYRNGLKTDLGTLGGTFSIATALNENGQVVGLSTTPQSGGGRAFLWQNGVMIDLGCLSGEPSGNSRALAINAQGQVVGSSDRPGGQSGSRAFLWQDGVMTDLGGLSNGSSSASAINDRGQIVGQSETASGETHATLWDGDRIIDLDTGQISFAWGINEKGQIVGGGTFASEVHSALWSPTRVTSAGDLAPDTRPLRVMDSPGSQVASRPALRLRSLPGARRVDFEITGASNGTYEADVYDIRGRRVRSWHGTITGWVEDSWNERDDAGVRVGRGMYFLRVHAPNVELHTKLIVG